MSVFQTKVKKEYQKNGYTVVKVVKFVDSGYPDLLAMKDGKCIWIECKEKNDKLSALQKFVIDSLIKNGFDAFCLQDTKGKIYPNETTKT